MSMSRSWPREIDRPQPELGRERHRDVARREHTLADEDLAEAAAGASLRLECRVELRLGDELLRAEDLAQTQPRRQRCTLCAGGPIAVEPLEHCRAEIVQRLTARPTDPQPRHPCPPAPSHPGPVTFIARRAEERAGRQDAAERRGRLMFPARSVRPNG